MSNFFQGGNQNIPEEVKQIIKYASEDEVTEIMLQSLRMAVENPEELKRAMPHMPEQMIASMKFFPKTDAALRPMAKAMATLLIKQVKHGETPSDQEVMKIVSEAMFSSGAMPGMGGMGGGTPFNIPPSMAGMPGMPSMADMAAANQSFAPSGPALPADLQNKVDNHISNGKNRLAEQEFEEAEKEFAAAVELLDKASVENDLLFTALQHQSIAQLEQAEYLLAEPVLKRWLRLGEKIFSPEYPLLAGAYLGLARVRESQSKMDDAELLYKRALSIAEKSGDEDLESYLATVESVAYFYESRKRYKKSDPLFERSYELRKKFYGKDTIEIAEYEIEYALVLNDRGSYQEAVEWCKKAIKIKTDLLGPADQEVLEALVQLGEMLFDAKEYKEAEDIIRTAIDGFGEDSCNDHCIDAKELLAQILRETDRNAEADELEKESEEDSEEDS